MRTVKVTAERDGHWWILECLEAGAVSQCRSLSQADSEVREAIAYQLAIPEDSFAIDVDVILPNTYKAEVARAEQLYRDADQTARQAAQARAHVAQTLAAEGLSVRDIGTIMGITFQRAHKLVNT